MHKYETIIVIDSLLKGDEIDNIINKYERFISANGGQIEAVERWGKRRLAYEIKKRQYGYYVLILFDGPPSMIRPLEREYRLNESLLRYKTLLVPKAAMQDVPPQQESGESEQPAQAAVESPEEQPATETESETSESEPETKESEPTSEPVIAEAESSAEEEAEEEQEENHEEDKKEE